MQKHTLAALAACGFFAAGIARADIVTTTWTGNVIADNYFSGDRGVDYLGIFGSPGQNLVGSAFTITTVFDTVRGGLAEDSSYFNLYNDSFPETYWTSTISINGNSATIFGNIQEVYSGRIIENNLSSINQFFFDNYPQRSGVVGNGISMWADVPASIKVSSPLDADCVSDCSRGFFYFRGGNTTTTSTGGGLQVNHVVITDAPGDSAPEPATWGLLVLGFGLTGFALRRGHFSRRQVAAALTC